MLDLLLHTPASVPSVAEEGDSSSGKGVNGLGRSPLRDILLHSPCITRTGGQESNRWVTGEASARCPCDEGLAPKASKEACVRARVSIDPADSVA